MVAEVVEFFQVYNIRCVLLSDESPVRLERTPGEASGGGGQVYFQKSLMKIY